MAPRLKQTSQKIPAIPGDLSLAPPSTFHRLANTWRGISFKIAQSAIVSSQVFKLAAECYIISIAVYRAEGAGRSNLTTEGHVKR